MNPMKEIRLDKLTLNICMGEAGPALKKGEAILKKITNKKVVVTKTRKRSSFGVSKGRPLGLKVTLRGSEAKELAQKLFKAVDNTIKESSFDTQGNFSFGIGEYIDIPGIKYDPKIGILGMDVCLTLTRPGYRIKDRRIRPKKIGKNHKITPEEAMEWAKKTFKITIE